MSKKDKGSMPMAQAGLVRYFDTDEGMKIKPQLVIGIGVGFAVVVLLLKFLG
jgi:preprotein translocase subunit Sec61beta